jgi:lipopolysaccharide exporter
LNEAPAPSFCPWESFVINSDQPSFGSFGHSIAQGATWMVAMRWTIRLIGLVNTVILARVLTPQDFGLVAMATVAIGLLDTVTGFNVDLPLIRNRVIGRYHYDSAWTLQVASGLIKSGLYLCVAPLLVKYYGDPRVGTVACIIALRPAIEGFENIGQVDFRRDLQFGKEFRYWVYRRLLAFVLTIGITLWLRDYLALALAAPISAAVTVFLSYVMSSYRPGFSTRYLRDFLTFSKWWMVIAFMSYFGTRGEAFILGGVTSPQIIGAYTVSANLTEHLTSDVVGPIGRSLMPNYAKMSNSPAHLLRAFQLSFAVLATFSLAAGVGASLVAKELVLVLLGANWLIAAPFVQLLAIHSAFWAIVESMQPYFLATNRERLLSLCMTGYVAVLIPAIVIAAHTADVETVAMTRTATTILFAAGMLGVLVATGTFSLKALVSFLWRPLVASAVMAVCVGFIDLSAPPIIVLILRVTTGLIIFPTVLILLWSVAGRPNGLESTISRLLSDYTRLAWERLRKTA